MSALRVIVGATSGSLPQGGTDGYTHCDPDRAPRSREKGGTNPRTNCEAGTNVERRPLLVCHTPDLRGERDEGRAGPVTGRWTGDGALSWVNRGAVCLVAAKGT